MISRWPDFLYWARTTLVAVGIEPVALDLRDAKKKGWDRGLTERSFIITDSSLGSKLPAGCRAHVFHLISDASIEELRSKLNESDLKVVT